jgi:putative transposase
LQEIIRARERRRRELRRTIEDRRKAVDSLLESRRGIATEGQGGEIPTPPAKPEKPKRTLKRYADD